MKRRDFIHNASHALAGAGLFGGLSPYSATRMNLNKLVPFNLSNDHVLVVIFLNGGNDGLNSVVPLNQLSILNSLRPQVFIPESKLLPLNNTELAFHPSMEGMRTLYDEDRLKIIRAVGYQDQNFSHFRSSDIWMSGSDAREVLNSGWAGRYLDVDYPGYPNNYPTNEMPDPLAVEIGFGNSLLFQGPASNMSVVINGERDFYELFNDEVDKVPDTMAGVKLAHVKLIRRQTQVYGEVVRNAAAKVQSQSPYPETNLAQQLKLVARMIAGGLKTPIYKVELGGFDTHGNQVDVSDSTKGVHTELLRELNDAIVAFMADLEFLGIQDRVMGMTFSEFGRRIVSNASYGTDHGAAGPMFIFGNNLEPGILGNDYELDMAMDFTDNLAYQFDFRQIYATMLEQWLCVPGSEVNAALRNAYEPLSIVRPGACEMSTSIHEIDRDTLDLQIYPNPSSDFLKISFNTYGGAVFLDLLDGYGQKIQSLMADRLYHGRFEKEFNISFLPSGIYFIQLYTSKERSRGKFVKI